MKKRNKKKPINEYDYNPADSIKKSYKKRRRLRKIKLLTVLLLIGALGYYFYSPYSKIQTITISGNYYVDTQQIQETLQCDENSIRLFCWTSTIKSRVSQLAGVRTVAVEKSLFDGLKVYVTENTPIAYQQNESSMSIVFDNGTVKEISDMEKVKKLSALPKLSQFTDEDLYIEFAQNFAQVEESVRTQISDIIFEPLDSDPTRVKMLSDDGKESYVRIEDMVYQLQYYNRIVSQNSENCYFDFLGSNVYQRACD